MIKLCAVTTLPITMKAFLLENLKYLAKNGFEVTIICSYDEELVNEKDLIYIPIEINRGIDNPFKAIRSIINLIKVFKKENFEIVQYATTNAGLYASIAAWLTRVPNRVYCQWGFLYISYNGSKRRIFKFIELLTCALSTVVQPDSYSNLKFAQEENLIKSESNVLWNGSAAGVDLNRFDINKKVYWRKEIRDKYGILDGSFIFGFVGRIVKDKGINELLKAFKLLNNSNSHLLLVGPIEDEHELDYELFDWATQSKFIHFVGVQKEVERYFASFDFLVLPSYREGFGMVVIEAAALAIPAIVSEIPGPSDVIKNNYNGYLVKVGDAIHLKEVMENVLNLSRIEYKIMSENAWIYAKENFNRSTFQKMLLEDRLRIANKDRGALL